MFLRCDVGLFGVFLLNKTTCVLVEQDNMSSCWARTHVFLLSKSTCLLVEQQDMSSCSTRRHVLLLNRKTCSTRRRHLFLQKKTCLVYGVPWTVHRTNLDSLDADRASFRVPWTRDRRERSQGPRETKMMIYGGMVGLWGSGIMMN